MKRVAIYLRVSTDKQTTENQLRELQGVGDDVGHRRIVRVNDLTVARPGWACCAERSRRLLLLWGRDLRISRMPVAMGPRRSPGRRKFCER